jgi:malate permease and related proteins
VIAFLSELGSVYQHALLPLVFYCGIGVVAFRFLDLDRKSLSKISVYVLLPPLFFTNLMKVDVPLEAIFKVGVFCVSVLTAMAVIGRLYARLVRFDAATTSSAVLSATFFNGVNLGFPMALFAFGEEGLYYAGLLIAVNAVPHNGFSIYVAARGQMSRRDAALALAKMPIFYVLILAVVARLLRVEVPEPIMQPIATLGQAAIPVILICIGMELASIRIGQIHGKLLGIVALRLCVAPVVAMALTHLIGISGLLQSVLILVASMPSAMAPIVYARVFGGNVESLTQAVFYSTIGSFFSLPILLMLLR